RRPASTRCQKHCVAEAVAPGIAGDLAAVVDGAGPDQHPRGVADGVVQVDDDVVVPDDRVARSPLGVGRAEADRVAGIVDGGESAPGGGSDVAHRTVGQVVDEGEGPAAVEAAADDAALVVDGAGAAASHADNAQILHGAVLEDGGVLIADVDD